jgi:hypothetical protein
VVASSGNKNVLASSNSSSWRPRYLINPSVGGGL